VRAESRFDEHLGDPMLAIAFCSLTGEIAGQPSRRQNSRGTFSHGSQIYEVRLGIRKLW
jgi:hypothetical protein